MEKIGTGSFFIIISHVTDEDNWFKVIYESTEDRIVFNATKDNKDLIQFSFRLEDTVQTDEWYHVAIIRDGGTPDKWFAFVNGKEREKRLA